MSYSLNELFLTLQGEGIRSGRRAVFARFSGCNGWSGREADRARGPLGCSAWCDTDFVGTDGPGGGRYEAAGLAQRCSDLWGSDRAHRYVVLTGGEPMLQVDRVLIDTLRRFGFEVAIETNGTIKCPDSLDWITVSPKLGGELIQLTGQELKLVYPQEGMDPTRYEGLAFRHHFLQPKWVADEAERTANIRMTTDYCLAHPRWRLGIQMHKIVGLP